jgi:hypothetical protein
MKPATAGFAFVMASGIVSVAASLQGLPVTSDALLAVACVTWVSLAARLRARSLGRDGRSRDRDARRKRARARGAVVRRSSVLAACARRRRLATWVLASLLVPALAACELLTRSGWRTTCTAGASCSRSACTRQRVTRSRARTWSNRRTIWGASSSRSRLPCGCWRCSGCAGARSAAAGRPSPCENLSACRSPRSQLRSSS